VPTKKPFAQLFSDRARTDDETGAFGRRWPHAQCRAAECLRWRFPARASRAGPERPPELYPSRAGRSCSGFGERNRSTQSTDQLWIAWIAYCLTIARELPGGVVTAKVMMWRDAIFAQQAESRRRPILGVSTGSEKAIPIIGDADAFGGCKRTAAA